MVWCGVWFVVECGVCVAARDEHRSSGHPTNTTHQHDKQPNDNNNTTKHQRPKKVFDSDFGPTDELMGVTQMYFSEEAIETDEETGGQRVVFKPR